MKQKQSADPALQILSETPDWVAVMKPAGLATIPGRAETDSVLERLGRQLGLPSSGTADPRVRVVHRLDKDTSGVLLFAKHTRPNATFRTSSKTTRSPRNTSRSSSDARRRTRARSTRPSIAIRLIPSA